jgi:hypothetical protein
MARVLEKNKTTKVVRKEVARAFREIFSDPDFGLKLQPAFLRRLRNSIRSANAGRVSDLKEFLRKKK